MARIGSAVAPAFGWLLDHDWALETVGWIIVACTVGTVLFAAYLLLHAARHTITGICWTAGRLRHQRDVRRMARQPLPPYSPSLEDLANYRTIRDAWRQPTRKETKR
ncbi:hypothetical protein [Streptomyces sp. SAS_275]|uniref:hypothetical protein n=1 Tax=Streptomyces sp. SAS_275 TaxID=3412746 RepID=UPI00403C9939